MKKNFRLSIVIFSILLFSKIIYAAGEQSWYDVEVVVFEHLATDFGEDFSDQMVRTPFFTDYVKLISGPKLDNSASQLPFKILPKSKWRFQKTYHWLKKSSYYKPILHIAWRQPAACGQLSKKVFLEWPPRREVENSASASADVGQKIKSIPSRLVGTVKVCSRYYLHASLDLVFLNNESLLQSTYQYFQLQETRKIKLSEKHYFDHPHFGLLLEVRKSSIKK